MSARRQIPDALLERLLADALTPEARAGLEAKLASSEVDRLRLDELRAESAAFLVQHPPARFAAQLEQKRPKRLWFALLVPAALAASLLVVVRRQQVEEPEWAVKGNLALAIYVRNGERTTRLGPGESVSPGAAIRFEVRAPEAGYVAIVGKDSRGSVSVYHPYGADKAGPYDPKSPLLETAIELDDAPGSEELFALYGREPFELSWATGALDAGEKPEERAPQGVQVSRFVLQKK